MCDDLRKLRRLDAVVEREFEVIRQRVVWLRPIIAATVTMLRSRGERPGRFHTSPRRRSCVIFVERRRNHLNLLAGGALVAGDALAGIASVKVKAKSESRESPVRGLMSISPFLGGGETAAEQVGRQRRYCSSLTFSSQSTFLPF